MEDFKSTAKMQCFREGGSVQYKSRHSEKREMSEDIAQDKKVVKKAFAMHDKQEHKGEKTDLSKLKKGGRAKKDCGTVKKYKCGGGVYGAKKTDADIKSIDDAKKFKPKKLQAGGMSGQGNISDTERAMVSSETGQGAMSDLEKRRQMEKMARAKKYLGPAQQGELISQDPTAAGLPASPAAPIMRKKGGKACK